MIDYKGSDINSAVYSSIFRLQANRCKIFSRISDGDVDA